MNRTETEYFMLREQQERSLAERCEDPSARLAHLNMANEYRQRLASSVPQPAYQSAA